MDELEKREMQEELKMVYQIDRFIDGNPYIENRIEKAVEQRVEKAVEQRVEKAVEQRIEQRIAEEMQQMLLTEIKDRFPTLANQAQPQIERIQDADTLKTLFRQLLAATMEGDVRRILRIQEKQ